MPSSPASSFLTQRQQREASYYEQFAKLHRIERVDFAPALSAEERPWSPFWQLCRVVRNAYRGPHQQLLDFGCGPGVAALTFASIGFQVSGFDLCQANVDAAKDLAQRHDLSHQCDFRAMPAEKLDYPDAKFDVVVGVDILHHVEIPRAIAEVHRVLKPGGIAIFKEPVNIALLEKIRTSWLVNKLVPRATSLEKHIHTTDDERKLDPVDIAAITSVIPIERTYHFSFFNRFARLMPKHYGKLMWMDYQMFRACPMLRGMGDVRIWVCRKSA